MTEPESEIDQPIQPLPQTPQPERSASPPQANDHLPSSPSTPPHGPRPTAPLPLVRASRPGPQGYISTCRYIPMSPINPTTSQSQSQKQVNPPESDGEDEIDPPQIQVDARGGGGITGGRGRGRKCRRY